eukprot:TRINITY_DN10792_c0_g1_i2.p2 TRINITY_DN10792_c0_g1~~TRINITY_DN10792_c0_g1_i2.p2  ORF type:complete len:295 (-),score=-29.08 TRINITY_DN10792_c0_g1_i2:130-1014(-)
MYQLIINLYCLVHCKHQIISITIIQIVLKIIIVSFYFQLVSSIYKKKKLNNLQCNSQVEDCCRQILFFCQNVYNINLGRIQNRYCINYNNREKKFKNELLWGQLQYSNLGFIAASDQLIFYLKICTICWQCCTERLRTILGSFVGMGGFKIGLGMYFSNSFQFLERLKLIYIFRIFIIFIMIFMVDFYRLNIMFAKNFSEFWDFFVCMLYVTSQLQAYFLTFWSCFNQGIFLISQELRGDILIDQQISQNSTLLELRYQNLGIIGLCPFPPYFSFLCRNLGVKIVFRHSLGFQR